MTSSQQINFVLIVDNLSFIDSCVGFVVDFVTGYLRRLRAGNSAVFEEGHTLVIGWTKRTIDFILQATID